MNIKGIQGSSVVGFVFILATVLLPFFGAIAILGFVYSTKMALIQAVDAGIKYSLANASMDTAAIVQAANMEATQVGLPRLPTSTFNAWLQCGDGSPCTNPCSCTGNNKMDYNKWDSVPWVYLKLTGTYSYTPILVAKYLGIPSTINLQHTAYIRLE